MMEVATFSISVLSIVGTASFRKHKTQTENFIFMCKKYLILMVYFAKNLIVIQLVSTS